MPTQRTERTKTRKRIRTITPRVAAAMRDSLDAGPANVTLTGTETVLSLTVPRPGRRLPPTSDIDRLGDAPMRLAHRDFKAANLMVVDGGPDASAPRLIDLQGGEYRSGRALSHRLLRRRWLNLVCVPRPADR